MGEQLLLQKSTERDNVLPQGRVVNISIVSHMPGENGINIFIYFADE